MVIHVGFGTNDKFLSRLIRWATKSDLSHSWIEYKSKTWVDWLGVHSITEGITIERRNGIRSRYPKHKVFICEKDLTNGLISVRHHLGVTEYDFCTAIYNGILLVIYNITRWDWLFKCVARDYTRLTCSEFVTLVLQNAGVEGAKKFDPELTTTGMLVEFCTQSKDFKEIKNA